MSFRSRLILFGYPLLEVATVYVVAQWIGWGWTLLAIVLGFPVGFAIMRNAGDAAMADMVKAANSGQAVDSGRHGLTFVGGVLVAIPGFWTDLVGLLLAIPWTQHLFRKRARTWFEARFTTVRMPGIRYPNQGDVIQGTVIKRDEPGPTPPAQPPELQG
jgi:UPF0716 family protein affecting phage T7 exclusion